MDGKAQAGYKKVFVPPAFFLPINRPQLFSGHDHPVI